MKKLLFLALAAYATCAYTMEGQWKKEGKEEIPQQQEQPVNLEEIKDFLYFGVPEFEKDEQGNPIRDEKGDLVLKVDEDGNPIYRSTGVTEQVSEYLKDILGSQKTLMPTEEGQSVTTAQSVTIVDPFFLKTMLLIASHYKKNTELGNELLRSKLSKAKEIILMPQAQDRPPVFKVKFEGATVWNLIPSAEYLSLLQSVGKLDTAKKTDQQVNQIILLNKIISKVKNSIADGKNPFEDDDAKYALNSMEEQYLFYSLPKGLPEALEAYVIKFKE